MNRPPAPAPRSSRHATPRLSVIVPFAPGEAEGQALFEQLRALPADAEIIAVYADPARQPEAKAPVAAFLPKVREFSSAPGRARQMNVGARAGRGRWLWFLHSDSRLCPQTLAALRRFLDREEDALGYFDLRYRNDGPRLARLNAIGANLRSRWLGLPFGDQGFVLPAAWFSRLGGYDESAACGEDHLLVWRARGAGLSLRRIGAPLATSARKYARDGWWRVTRRHARLTLRQALPERRRLREARRVLGREDRETP